MERLTKLPWPDRLGLGIALLAAMGGFVVGLGLSTNGKANGFDWVLVPLVLTIAIGLPA